MRRNRCIVIALLVIALSLATTQAFAVSVPEDPSHSIRYWKPQVIHPESDGQVAHAHRLFEQLLGAWDISRVEPSLNVVSDSSGPWAASLADGNILLSRTAIDICMGFGKHRGKHLLAFILAHELAHQKANDLWHQQFFRLIGNQSSEITEAIRQDLAIDQHQVSQVEAAEAQADLDAVVMMASVGYDPYQIIRDNDFYTSWIENMWQQPCAKHIPACEKAKERALRTKAQLESISDQAVLYELGIQALVAKHYDKAREYLTAYARNFPGRSVHNSIGVSYLAEAISLWPQYAAQTGKPNLYFPLFVEATPAWQNDGAAKRGSSAQIKADIFSLAEQALNFFDKAQRLSPHHRNTTYLRALSYLLMENSPMANGVIEGQYVPNFGENQQAQLLRALSFAIAGNTSSAETHLSMHTNSHKVSQASQGPLLFAMIQNQAHLAEFHKKPAVAKKLWKNFALSMSKQGQGYLLQLALNKVNPKTASTQENPGLHYKSIQLNTQVKGPSEKQVWFDGDPLYIHRDNSGVWLSDKDKQVVALWLTNAKFSGLDRLNIGDTAERVIRVIGPADRQISLNSGEFLAYDQYGLAVRIQQNKISSWFLYDNTN